MARIVHICNTLQNRKYLSLCTVSSLLTVVIVTYVWNTTSTHSGIFQNGRLHTEPDTVKNRLFSFFFFFFLLSVGLTRYSLNYWSSFTYKSAPFSSAQCTISQFSKKTSPKTSPKRHFFSVYFNIECM